MTNRKGAVQTNPYLVSKLLHMRTRKDAMSDLGAKTEKEASAIARRYITHATKDAIIMAIQVVESCKLKSYSSVRIPDGIIPQPYAGIPESFLKAKITVAELAEWIEIIKRNTYAGGTKYQPLPSHDEAWQAFSRLNTELYFDRQTALQFLNCRPIDFSPEEIREAVTLYWDMTPISLRRQAYKLLPDEIKASISSRYQGNPEGAMNATRDFYLTPQAS